MGSLGGASWREAWRGRRDNPLPAYWRAAAERAQERRPWWKRNPGLLLTGVLASAAATLALSLLLAHLLDIRLSPVASRSYATSLAALGTIYLAAAAALTAWVWLLARVYQAAHFALGLLAHDARGRSGEGLDDAVAATPLSAEEVVVGALMRGLNLLGPPVLTLSALGGVIVCAQWLYANAWHVLDVNGGVAGLLQHGILGALLAGLVCGLLHYACGMLAAALLILIWLSLGASPRAGMLPATGAAAWTTLAILLTVGGAMVWITDVQASGYSVEDYVIFQIIPMTAAAVIWGALLIVSLICARWTDGLRQFAAYAGVPLFITLVLVVDWVLVQDHGDQVALAISGALCSSQVLGLANGAQFIPQSSLDTAYGVLVQAVRWPLLLALQLALLPIAKGFACAAVRRRREGAR